MPLSVTASQCEQRGRIIAAIREYTRSNSIIPMGDPKFSGEVDRFVYFFEGEDDLLHLGVSRLDQESICVEDAQEVLSFLLPGLPWGVVWLKPSTFSHHFYVGHDELLALDPC